MKPNKKVLISVYVLVVAIILVWPVKAKEVFFDYTKPTDTSGLVRYDKWHKYNNRDYVGNFSDRSGTVYKGIGMDVDVKDASATYAQATYNVPKNVSSFETKIFIDKNYCGTSNHGKTIFYILIDNNTVYTSAEYNESFNAQLVKVSIPDKARTITLKLRTERGSRGTHGCVWANPVFHQHTPSKNWVILKAATCTETGNRVQYCSECNELAVSEVIPLQPHKPVGNWVIITEPTCTIAGTQVIYCEVCGGVAKSESIKELPHIITDWVVIKEPLCDETGQKVKYCEVGKEEVEREIIPSLTGLDHVFKEPVIKGSIFIPPIVTTEECEVCGFTRQHTDWTYAWVSPSILLGLILTLVFIRKARTDIKKKRTFVCPYCFETHFVHQIQFRCSNRNCEDADDVELTKYEGGDISLPLKAKKTFSPPRNKNYSIPKNAKCPSCGSETSKVVCPSCHNSLPESTLIGKDMIISVVGSRDVGKSHFVGIIINELIERVAGKFDGSLTGFDDTMARYEENFGRSLYVDLTKLDLTRSSLVNKNNGAYKPLIFTLSVRAAKSSANIRNYTLVFYDTAGEDLNEFDTMSTVNRYICKSAGIIFLLDPMQIWSVRNQLDDEIVTRASTVAVQQATRPDDIMTRVSRLIRNDKKMDSTRRIDIPVAAVFSKFDAIVSIVPKDCNVLSPSPHSNEGTFVMSDWHNVNTEIQGLLKSWGATAFTQQLEINYTNYSYFAASALGLDNNPRSDRHIDRPRPHRIEDALLWILKENKVIKTRN